MKECFICKNPSFWTITVEGEDVCLKCRDTFSLALIIRLLKEIEELRAEIEEKLKEVEAW